MTRITLRDAAKIVGVHRETFSHWVRDGKVPCVKTLPGGKRNSYIIYKEDITRWLKSKR